MRHITELRQRERQRAGAALHIRASMPDAVRNSLLAQFHREYRNFAELAHRTVIQAFDRSRDR